MIHSITYAATVSHSVFLFHVSLQKPLSIMQLDIDVQLAAQTVFSLPVYLKYHAVRVISDWALSEVSSSLTH